MNSETLERNKPHVFLSPSFIWIDTTPPQDLIKEARQAREGNGG
jgi:hypothetical protein